MNMCNQLPGLVALLTILRAGVCLGAATPSTTDPFGGMLVGDLGAKEALVIEGNQTFSRETIFEALSWELEFHLVSHRLAPLANYPPWLERQLTLGYRFEGFADATVKVAADTNTHRILVQIQEGPRYHCGEIRLSGAPSMTNEVVRQKITELLAGVEVESNTKATVRPSSSSQRETGNVVEVTSSRSVHVEQHTRVEGRVWYPDVPAPLDEFSHRQLANLVSQALGDLGWFQPKVDIRMVPDPATKLAELRIEILDPGVKATIEEIEVTGIRATTRQQVLDYLQLTPGMAFKESILRSASKQLWQSARFLHHDLRLQDLPEKGKIRLTLDLEELPEAPPLNMDLAPEEKALLKSRDWLADWPNQSEDIVASIHLSNRWVCLEGDVAISPSGVALVARTGSSNDRPELQYAMVANPTLQGFYSAWRQNKHVIKDADGTVRLFLNIGPNPVASSGNRWQMSFGGGISSLREGSPLRIEMDLAPVAFLSAAHEDGIKATLNDNVLTLKTSGLSDEADERLEAQIEAATGRLIQLRMEVNGQFLLTLHSKEGAFAHSVREIAAATAAHTNSYSVGHGFSSWLGFHATDLIHSPLIERLFLEQIEQSFSPERRLEALAKCAVAKLFLAQTRQDLDQQKLTRIFEPIDRLFSMNQDWEGDEPETFSIPLATDQRVNQMAAAIAGLCSYALAHYDSVAPRNSWPWVLLREATFVLANESRYTQAELENLMKSDTLGPVGCLSTAVLLGRVNPRSARAFAELGLSRLTVADFERDYRLLVQPDRVLNRVLANTMELLGEFREEQVTLLTAGLNPDWAAFLQHLSRLIRERGDQPPAVAAWPAWAEHWEKTTRRSLEAGLKGFMRPVLTDPQALYERGRMLVSNDSLLRDFEEAAQCFRKAAEQGHAGAQLELGLCYEYGKGVTQDLDEAMHWYQKAAEQKEPHAACTIARLYWQGKGVEKSMEEAEKWLRRELAEPGECPDAEYHLGRIHEMNRNWTEALKSYRHAAELGSTEAQARLGDLLSDGFTVPPDYREACQWLILAAQSGSKAYETKMYESSLRFVKAKLTPEEVKEAEQQAYAIKARLAAKDEGQK